MKRVLILGAGLAIVALAATRAQATPIGNITTSDGLTFTLSNDGAAATDLNTADSTFDTQQFTLTLDSSGYTGNNTDLLTAVSLKLSAQLDQASQQSAPSANWTYQAGGLNNGSCDGSGGGFFCTDVSSVSQGVVLNGSSYTWTFWVDPTGAFTLPGDIKAQWFTSGGTKVGQLSEGLVACSAENDCGSELPPPSVPEPTTLLLLSSGLAGVVGSKLRRRSAR
jgi:PEP-CTERM motif-containing protein